MNAADGSGEPTPRAWGKGAIVTHNGGGRGKIVDPRGLARALEPYRRTGGAAPPPPDHDEEQEGGR